MFKRKQKTTPVKTQEVETPDLVVDVPEVEQAQQVIEDVVEEEAPVTAESVLKEIKDDGPIVGLNPQAVKAQERAIGIQKRKEAREAEETEVEVAPEVTAQETPTATVVPVANMDSAPPIDRQREGQIAPQSNSQTPLNNSMEQYNNPLALPQQAAAPAPAQAVAPQPVQAPAPAAPAPNPGVIVGVKVTESGLYETVIRSNLPLAEIGQELNF